MKIKVEKNDITNLEVDAIVNPANSFGTMGGGVAGVIKKIGGREIEKESTACAPVPVGSAVITTAGKLKCKHVIHAPTMEKPAELIGVENIKKATRAALDCAEKNNFKKIGIPGMGTGVGRVPKNKAAKAMLDVIINFDAKNLEEVILVDKNGEMIKEWNKFLKF